MGIGSSADYCTSNEAAAYIVMRQRNFLILAGKTSNKKRIEHIVEAVISKTTSNILLYIVLAQRCCSSIDF
jgi:hypothetical protein